jgi:hypothetical protein
MHRIRIGLDAMHTSIEEHCRSCLGCVRATTCARARVCVTTYAIERSV